MANLPGYRVWYLKLNLPEPLPSRALWLRWTTLEQPTPKQTKAETWAIFFDRTPSKVTPLGFKNSLPLSAFQPLAGDGVTIGDCVWNPLEGKTSGRVGEIEWDLRFESLSKPFFHVPKLLQRWKLNSSTVWTPHPNLRFTGSLRVGSTSFSLDRAPGMQGRIEGKKSAHHWCWAHANQSVDGTPFVFEGLTATLKPGVPALSAFFFETPEGRFEFNSLSQAFFSDSHSSLNHWRFKTHASRFSSPTALRFEGEIHAPSSSLAGIRYEDTDGSALYCHNSKLSSLTLRVFRGRDLLREIRSHENCAYEWVTRSLHPEVPEVL